MARVLRGTGRWNRGDVSMTRAEVTRELRAENRVLTGSLSASERRCPDDWNVARETMTMKRMTVLRVQESRMMLCGVCFIV